MRAVKTRTETRPFWPEDEERVLRTGEREESGLSSPFPSSPGYRTLQGGGLGVCGGEGTGVPVLCSASATPSEAPSF